MALNKNGMDLRAIARDQKAIDALPNRGRASVDHSAKHKALKKKTKSKEADYSKGRFSATNNQGRQFLH